MCWETIGCEGHHIAKSLISVNHWLGSRPKRDNLPLFPVRKKKMKPIDIPVVGMYD